ncbi:hypothetical protein GCM10007981_00020 [Thermocladium modestius]|uniref:Uncharacterized protein n=2 Tax=Thermocladium modestius TaxID=62609 RepID=A0A830GQJ3_9CREN|nr:hypothetical protein GCM10007981_00020 [Thermocladium modestius]
MVAEGVYWTPVILLNSPYPGSASAAQSVSYTATYTFSSGPLTLTSQASTTLSQTIYANNGEAIGLFRLDKWGIYNTKLIPIIAGYYPCSQPYVAKDLGSATNPPTFRSIPILPNGTASDINEPNQIYYNGYYSIQFNNGFSNNLLANYGTCASPAILAVSQSSSTLLIAGVGVSINGYDSSGSIEIQGSTTNSWTYYLPQGYIWDISYAGGQGPAYAFEYLGQCQ